MHLAEMGPSNQNDTIEDPNLQNRVDSDQNLLSVVASNRQLIDETEEIVYPQKSEESPLVANESKPKLVENSSEGQLRLESFAEQPSSIYVQNEAPDLPREPENLTIKVGGNTIKSKAPNRRQKETFLERCLRQNSETMRTVRSNYIQRGLIKMSEEDEVVMQSQISGKELPRKTSNSQLSSLKKKPLKTIPQ